MVRRNRVDEPAKDNVARIQQASHLVISDRRASMEV
jgi:hypothetical protein